MREFTDSIITKCDKMGLLSPLQKTDLFPPDAELAEKRYDWTGAAKIYSEHLAQFKNDLSSFSELARRMGQAHVNAAFQSNKQEQFAELLSLALNCHNETASRLQGVEENKADFLYHRSRVSFIKGWLADKLETQVQLFTESAEHAKRSAEIYEEAGVNDNAAESYYALLLAYEELIVRSRGLTYASLVRDGMSMGQRGLDLLQKSMSQSPLTLTSERSLAKFYAEIHALSKASEDFVEDEEERKKLEDMHKEYAEKIAELADNLRDPEILLENAFFKIHKGGEQAQRSMEELEPRILETGDNLCVAAFYELKTSLTRWAMYAEESTSNLHKMLSVLEANFSQVERRIQLIKPIGFYWIAFTDSYYNLMSGYIISANVESTLEKKKEYLEKAIQIGRKSLPTLQIFNSIHLIWLGLAIALKLKAEIETDFDKGRALLDEALSYARKNLTLITEVSPRSWWDLGVSWVELASMQFRRSSYEYETKVRVDLIREAIQNFTKGTELFEKHGKESDEMKNRPGPDARVATWLEEQSRMLEVLHQLTGERDSLIRQLAVLNRARHIHESVNLPSRVAETCWQVGTVQSLLAEHAKASSAYEEAAEFFLRASQKMPEVSQYYEKYSSYMRIWSEIEKARESHSKGDFRDSGQRYEKVSQQFSEMNNVSYMSLYYQGCGLLEKAQDTASENEVVELFQSAGSLFEQSYRNVQELSKTAHSNRQREDLRAFAETSTLRQKYCMASALIEKAKLSYTAGRIVETTTLYSSAVELLEEVDSFVRSQSDWERREIETVISTCNAWKKMIDAEGKGSSDLYNQAAELFLKAYGSATTNRTAMVARANANYCMALGSSLEFKGNWKIDDYVTAKSHLEEASNDYNSAGFPRVAQLASGTERMLDAYVYINSALKESDPDRRAKNYLAAEKLLKLSADIYEKAGYQAKKEEALSAVGKVREERDLTLSLVELFAAPSVVSSTASFPLPTLSQESPVGLAEFENVHVEIAASIPESEIKAEQGFQIRFDLINTGKEVAILHKMENMLPRNLTLLEHRFGNETSELDVNTGLVDFKGKRLKPLQIESLRFTVKTSEIGEKEFNPRVFYSDERATFSKKP